MRYGARMTITPTILVVQNTPESGPRRLGEWLTADGIRVDVAHPYRGDELPERLDHDAIIVLGGDFMPDADDRAPWLEATRRLVTEALSDAKPILGICLGGQLLAFVTGGSVRADAGAPENGSTAIRVRAEAAEDPVFAGLDDVVPAIEHHIDAITRLPETAVWLAETDRCPYQAFRVGDNAWGVQFHPEVDASRIETWDPARLRKYGLDRDELYQAALAAEPAAVVAWRGFATRFASVVRSSAAR